MQSYEFWCGLWLEMTVDGVTHSSVEVIHTIGLSEY